MIEVEHFFSGTPSLEELSTPPRSTFGEISVRLDEQSHGLGIEHMYWEKKERNHEDFGLRSSVILKKKHPTSAISSVAQQPTPGSQLPP